MEVENIFIIIRIWACSYYYWLSLQGMHFNVYVCTSENILLFMWNEDVNIQVIFLLMNFLF